MKKINFSKMGGLVPAVIQNCDTKAVLMVGFMNKIALSKTTKTKRVIFWSRSKNRLWEKGEKSGNYLEVVSITSDCDSDSILIMARPIGPTCHTGQKSCFGGQKFVGGNFDVIYDLYALLLKRKVELPRGSYSAQLFKGGIDAVAQKVGEEAIEVVIASKNQSKVKLAEESADLLYHLLALLVFRGVSLARVGAVLKSRQARVVKK